MTVTAQYLELLLQFANTSHSTYVYVIASWLGQPRDCAFGFWRQHDFMPNHLIFVDNPINITSSNMTADLSKQTSLSHIAISGHT